MSSDLIKYILQTKWYKDNLSIRIALIKCNERIEKNLRIIELSRDIIDLSVSVLKNEYYGHHVNNIEDESIRISEKKQEIAYNKQLVKMISESNKKGTKAKVFFRQARMIELKLVNKKSFKNKEK